MLTRSRSGRRTPPQSAMLIATAVNEQAKASRKLSHPTSSSRPPRSMALDVIPAPKSQDMQSIIVILMVLISLERTLTKALETTSIKTASHISSTTPVTLPIKGKQQS